jgi:hypothetical protein
MTNLIQYIPYGVLSLFVGFMTYEIVKLIYGSIQDKRNGKA